MGSHIEVVDTHKSFGPFKALNGIDLQIQRGEFLTLLGPSGSGKTTLLMILAGFQSPTRGALIKNGLDITAIPADQRNFGMVFQGYALFPHMTVSDNIGFPLRVRGVPAEERRKSIGRMIEMVGLGGHESKKPAALSGGQQQRVALARALVFEPELLLLDEPLSALDKKLREQLQSELKEIHRRTGTTFVFVTHDQTEALALSDRVAIFNKGRIAQIGTPQEMYSRPRDRFVAEFLGSVNIFPLSSTQQRDSYIEGPFGGELLCAPVPETYEPGSPAVLAVRPEFLELCKDGPRSGSNALRAVLSEKIYQGGNTILKMTASDGAEVIAIHTNTAQQSEPEINQPMWVTWPRECGQIIPDA